MKVSGGIVTYNSHDDIVKCIESILEHTKGIDFTLYVSDNCSVDDTVEEVRLHFPQVIILENKENGGYGYGHNKVIEVIDSDYHFVINPDIVLEENTIGNLVNYMEAHKEANIGQVTPKVLNMDGSEQFLPKRNPSIKYVVLSKFPGFKGYRRKYTRQEEALGNREAATEVELATGCFFGCPTRVLKELSGFDSRYYMYFEDADLSRRIIKKGYKVMFYPLTYVKHDWHRENTKSLRGIKNFLHSMTKYIRVWRR